VVCRGSSMLVDAAPTRRAPIAHKTSIPSELPLPTSTNVTGSQAETPSPYLPLDRRSSRPATAARLMT
jgi:hypothetical protein